MLSSRFSLAGRSPSSLRSILRTGVHKQHKQLKELSSTARKPGKLYSKGVGVLGALGQGDSLQDVSLFKKVLRPDAEEGDEILSVSAGWGHSGAVTKKGSLLVFGRPFDFRYVYLYVYLYAVCDRLICALICVYTYMLSVYVCIYLYLHTCDLI